MAASGEPTEEPTHKRLDEARGRGQVAVSRDLVSAAAMTAALATLTAVGPASLARLVAYWKLALTAAPGDEAPGPALLAGAAVLARLLAPPLAAAAAAALGVGLLQTRGLVALGAVRPDLGRLSPAAGLARSLGGEAAREVGKGLVKVMLFGALAWLTVRPALAGLASLAGAGATRTAAVLGALSARLALRVALVALALGAADYLLAHRRHRRALRMTRDEVKRESRETEGDPTHRVERQRLHRELLEQRMVAEVRKADFVVVNPEHIAVALRYDRQGDAAPVVLASGERLLAERIKQVAREAGVPIFRDVTLARSLRALPEGEEIPPALYEAVAEVLRVVYGTAPAGDQSTAPPGPQAEPAPVPPRIGGAAWKRA
ncbi:MAG TPA: EscU/YscU/HrcU family type III secretion system export apparatus switch protein [Polyangia bacterium]|nr:EscU/YscU/HrcU family type III secretion system export apparatus switch protein [Polyangia bacterium]